MDDFTEGYLTLNYSDYKIGIICDLFVPYANLRVSMNELTHLI